MIISHSSFKEIYGSSSFFYHKDHLVRLINELKCRHSSITSLRCDCTILLEMMTTILSAHLVAHLQSIVTCPMINYGVFQHI